MSKTLKQNIIEAALWLRIVQKDFGDEDERRRTEYLCEELDKRLKEIPDGEREPFLKELLVQFLASPPEGHILADPVCPSATVAPSLSEDPIYLVETLVARLRSAAPEQKEAVLRCFRDAAAELFQADGTSSESIKNLKSALHLSDSMDLRQERLANLASLLMEFVVKLERWTAAVWAELPSRSTVRPPKRLEEITRQFLSEDQRDAEDLTKELQSLQQFVTVIMGAGLKAGDEVARRHFYRFSPPAIQASVEMEPGGWLRALVSKEVLYWRKYCELAEELGAEYVDWELASAMAEYIETFLKKLEQSANARGGVVPLRRIEKKAKDP